MADVKKKLEFEVKVKNQSQIEALEKSLEKITKRYSDLLSKQNKTDAERTALKNLEKQIEDEQKLLFIETNRYAIAEKIARTGRAYRDSKSFIKLDAKRLKAEQEQEERFANAVKEYNRRLRAAAVGGTPVKEDFDAQKAKEEAAARDQARQTGFSRYSPTALLGEYAKRQRSARDEAYEAAAKAATQEEKDAALAQAAAADKAAASATVAVDAINTSVKIISGTINAIKSAFKGVLGISISLKENFQDILSSVNAMTDLYSGMATYATGSSLITNASARMTQMRYGLTASGAYAFTQTKQLLGIQTDEDLMYMNKSQRALFIEYMRRQEQFYDDLESSGTLQDIQEMQLEFALFRQELSMEFMKWFAENKDTIMDILRGIMDVTKWIMQTVTSIASKITGHQYTAHTYALNDAVASNNYSNRTNIYVNTTNNISGVISDQEQLTGTIGEYINQVARQLAVNTQ